MAAAQAFATRCLTPRLQSGANLRCTPIGAAERYTTELNMVLKPGLIVDKSWLDGASSSDIEAAIRRFHLLLPEMLLYELLTTESERRRASAGKLLSIDSRTFSSIGTLGSLLVYEAKHRRPCGSLLRHRGESRREVFQKLIDPGYKLSSEEAGALSHEQRNRECFAIQGFRTAAMALRKLSGGVDKLAGVDDERLIEIAASLLGERSIVVGLCRQLQDALGSSSDNFEDNSASFRRAQAHLLIGLAYVRSYGLTAINDAPVKKMVNLYHDTEYLVLGALAGALASQDRLLALFFRLMCPNGILIGRSA